MKILFLASEAAGLIKSGGLADVAKALPQQLLASGHDVRLVIPCYSIIKGSKDFPVIHSAVLNQNDPNSGLRIPYQVRKAELAGVEVWLIECERFFDRTSMYGDNNQAYGDNGSRYAFFTAAALEAARQIGFKPDILHCNDWHTGTGPMILRVKYGHDPFFDRTRSIITIHNAAFQGVFELGQLYVTPELQRVHNDMVIQGSYINFLKAGVYYADKINTVSPGYAFELTTYLGGHGMANNFIARKADLCGIVNGCDYSDWDPSSDKLLRIRYSIDDMEEKVLGKYLLQRKLGLEMGDTPIYGMVARLTDQKGVGLLLPILDRFLVHKVQIIIEGTGDPNLQRQMQEIADRHKDKMVFLPVYDNVMAHQIEAASDFFLMPSIFEPCGLNQIYSLAYGTLPIVRAVGGLRDTVIDYDQDREHGNGFIFNDASPEELLSCLRRTLILYHEDQDEMRRIRYNAMSKRFLWEDSCRQYEKLYEDALKKSKW